MAPAQKSLDFFNELQIQLEEEEKSHMRIRDAETEINVFIKTQRDEFSGHKLSVSFFDRNRNEKARNEILEQVSCFFLLTLILLLYSYYLKYIINFTSRTVHIGCFRQTRQEYLRIP